MDKITSVQGKEFNYSDILIYKRVGNQIVVLLDDKEQLKKFTNKDGEAPIAIIPYSEENNLKIASSMKQIEVYPNIDGAIKVKYKDGTNMDFSSDNIEIIESNVIEQRKAKYGVIGNHDIKPINLDELTGKSLEGSKLEGHDNGESVKSEEKRHKVKKIQKYEEMRKSEIVTMLMGSMTHALSLAAIALATFIMIHEQGIFKQTLTYYVAGGSASIFSLHIMIDSIAKRVNLKSKIEDLKEELGITDEDKKRGAK